MATLRRYVDADGARVHLYDSSVEKSLPPVETVAHQVIHQAAVMRPDEAVRWAGIWASVAAALALVLSFVVAWLWLANDGELVRRLVPWPAVVAWVSVPAVFVGSLWSAYSNRMAYDKGLVRSRGLAAPSALSSSPSGRSASRTVVLDDEDDEDDDLPPIRTSGGAFRRSTTEDPAAGATLTAVEREAARGLAVLAYAVKNGGDAPVPRAERNGWAFLPVLGPGGKEIERLDKDGYSRVALRLREAGLMVGGEGKPWRLAKKGATLQEVGDEWARWLKVA